MDFSAITNLFKKNASQYDDEGNVIPSNAAAPNPLADKLSAFGKQAQNLGMGQQPAPLQLAQLQQIAPAQAQAINPQALAALLQQMRQQQGAQPMQPPQGLLPRGY